MIKTEIDRIGILMGDAQFNSDSGNTLEVVRQRTSANIYNSSDIMVRMLDELAAQRIANDNELERTDAIINRLISEVVRRT